MKKLRDQGDALPRAAVAISPWTDLALTGQSLRKNSKADPMLDAAQFPMIAKRYLGEADPHNPYISPLYGDAAGLPPTLIQAGSDEVLLEDAVRMAEAMRQAGCEIELDVWPKMPHVWHLYARILPEGRQAIDRIGQFLDRKMERARDRPEGRPHARESPGRRIGDLVADVPVVLEVRDGVALVSGHAGRSVLQKHELAARSLVVMMRHLVGGRSGGNRRRAEDQGGSRNGGDLVDHDGILSNLVRRELM
jgi:hypothetical protein